MFIWFSTSIIQLEYLNLKGNKVLEVIYYFNEMKSIDLSKNSFQSLTFEIQLFRKIMAGYFDEFEYEMLLFFSSCQLINLIDR